MAKDNKLPEFNIAGATKGLASAMKDAQPGEKILELPVKEVQPDPGQPRKKFDKAKLEGLAEQIKRDGQLQAAIVRPVDDGKAPHMLVFGERRWRALQLAGMRTIKAVVRPYTEADLLEIRTAQMAENMQKADMTLAEIIGGVMDLVKRANTGHAAVTIGESKTYVSKLTKIAKAGGPVADVLVAGTLEDVNALYTLALAMEIDQGAVLQLVNSWSDPEKRAYARMQATNLYDKLRGVSPSSTAAGSDESNQDAALVRTAPGKESPRTERVARSGKDAAPTIPDDLPILVCTKVELTRKAVVLHTKQGILSFDKKLIEQIKRVK